MSGASMDLRKRRALASFARVFGAVAAAPARLPHDDRDLIAEPRLVGHTQWLDFLVQRFNSPGMRVLEVGSRVVTGESVRPRFGDATYVGFDIMAGENVDVVGDAHRLTTYFRGDDPFDLVFSSAVLEHLYMPWLAAEEMARMLRVGGYVFAETHFSYSSHERPWNFFQFSDMGLQALFNPGIGLRVLDKGASNPMMGYFTAEAAEYLRYQPVTRLYCHSEILCEKVHHVDAVDWRSIAVEDVVDGTTYPPPT
jgi:SAM-dependent methyltransferase